MKQYTSYESTTIPWNPTRPSHWKEYRGKRLFFSRKVKNVGNEEPNVLSLTLKGVIRNNKDKPIGLSPDDYSTYQIFEQGDLVFKLIDLENISTSRVGIVPERGIMSSAYIRLTSRSPLNIRYFYMQYYSLWLRNIYNGLGAGVRQTLSADELLNLGIVVPPAAEQDQIVRFLDWKVSRVNQLINTKRKEIKAIDAMKRSIVSSVVTRGLDSSAPMKFSGVKWLGNIPAHWDAIPLYAIAKEKSIPNCTDLDLLSVYLDDGVVPFSTRAEKRTNATSKDLSKYQRVDPGDFVLNNQQAWRGSVGVSFYTGIVSPAYIVLLLNDALDSNYANYLLRSRKMVDQYLVISRGVGSIQRNIYWSALKRVMVPVPPKEEQQTIIAYLAGITKKLQAATNSLNEEVTVLEEFKAKLIADVVTGKIDVRDVEIPEYEFVEEESDNNEETEGDEQTDAGDEEE